MDHQWVMTRDKTQETYWSPTVHDEAAEGSGASRTRTGDLLGAIQLRARIRMSSGAS